MITFSGGDLIRRLIPFDILIVTRERTPFPRNLIECLPNLKLLVTTGARNLAIDLAACRERGILVCGTDAGSVPTAELAWGLVLAVSRHIVEEDRALRSGKWQTTVGVALAGKTLGVLGLGRIGAQVAPDWWRFWHEGHCVEREFDRRTRRRGGLRSRGTLRLFRQADVAASTFCLVTDPWHRGASRTRVDEALRDSD